MVFQTISCLIWFITMPAVCCMQLVEYRAQVPVADISFQPDIYNFLAYQAEGQENKRKLLELKRSLATVNQESDLDKARPLLEVGDPDIQSAAGHWYLNHKDFGKAYDLLKKAIAKRELHVKNETGQIIKVYNYSNYSAEQTVISLEFGNFKRALLSSSLVEKSAIAHCLLCKSSNLSPTQLNGLELAKQYAIQLHAEKNAQNDSGTSLIKPLKKLTRDSNNEQIRQRAGLVLFYMKSVGNGEKFKSIMSDQDLLQLAFIYHHRKEYKEAYITAPLYFKQLQEYRAFVDDENQQALINTLRAEVAQPNTLGRDCLGVAISKALEVDQKDPQFDQMQSLLMDIATNPDQTIDSQVRYGIARSCLQESTNHKNKELQERSVSLLDQMADRLPEAGWALLDYYIKNQKGLPKQVDLLKKMQSCRHVICPAAVTQKVIDSLKYLKIIQDGQCAYILAHYYKTGIAGVLEPDQKTARDCFQKALKHSYPQALFDDLPVLNNEIESGNPEEIIGKYIQFMRITCTTNHKKNQELRSAVLERLNLMAADNSYFKYWYVYFFLEFNEGNPELALDYFVQAQKDQLKMIEDPVRKRVIESIYKKLTQELVNKNPAMAEALIENAISRISSNENIFGGEIDIKKLREWYGLLKKDAVASPELTNKYAECEYCLGLGYLKKNELSKARTALSFAWDCAHEKAGLALVDSLLSEAQEWDQRRVNDAIEILTSLSNKNNISATIKLIEILRACGSQTDSKHKDSTRLDDCINCLLNNFDQDPIAIGALMNDLMSDGIVIETFDAALKKVKKSCSENQKIFLKLITAHQAGNTLSGLLDKLTLCERAFAAPLYAQLLVTNSLVDNDILLRELKIFQKALSTFQSANDVEVFATRVTSQQIQSLIIRSLSVLVDINRKPASEDQTIECEKLIIEFALAYLNEGYFIERQSFAIKFAGTIDKFVESYQARDTNPNLSHFKGYERLLIQAMVPFAKNQIVARACAGWYSLFYLLPFYKKDQTPEYLAEIIDEYTQNLYQLTTQHEIINYAHLFLGELIYIKGVLLDKQGKYDKALECYRSSMLYTKNVTLAMIRAIKLCQKCKKQTGELQKLIIEVVKNCDNKQLKYNVAHALYYGAYVNFNSQEDGTTFQVPFLKDQRKGFHYFNELSDAGYGKASLKLADLALEVHDEKLAEELFGTALKNGCNDAAVSLGYMYFKKGVDHKVNYLKAVELFKKPNLAASKHAQAELMLCVMYKNGLGVKQSDSKFREHLEKFLKIYSATPALTQDQKKLLYTIYKDYAVYDHIEKIKKDDLDAFLALELRSFGMQFLHKNKQNAEQEYVKQQLEALTGSQNISHVALPALAKLISFKYFEQKMDCPSIMKYFSRMLNCVKTNPTPDNKDALLSYAKSIMRKINSLCEKNQTAIKQAHDYVQMIRELCISLSLDDNQLNDLLNVLKHITFTITDENEEPET